MKLIKTVYIMFIYRINLMKYIIIDINLIFFTEKLNVKMFSEYSIND